MNRAWEALCPGCFREKGGAAVCPYCGYDESVRRSPLALPHRTLLQGQFLIGRVLGKPGGFGITYLAYDVGLETRVAVKEYLPRDLAGREAGQTTVVAHSREEGELFRFGLEQFIKEARTLAKFDHAHIVRVRHVFEQNATAYLVMDYYEGLTLAEYLTEKGRLPEQTALAIITPILDGLREVHGKGFLHRDIKPQNIYITTESRPILLDFGSARVAMGERTNTMSVVLTPGYAPFEQYHKRGEQGEWTDIYSCAAVLYQMLTGEVPPEAPERADQDELVPPSAMRPDISPAVNQAILDGLALKPRARPQTVRDFQDRLRTVSTPRQPPPGPHQTAPPPPPIASPVLWGGVAVLGVAVLWAVANRESKEAKPPAPQEVAPPAETSGSSSDWQIPPEQLRPARREQQAERERIIREQLQEKQRQEEKRAHERQAAVQAVRSYYAALGGRDVSGVLALLDPDGALDPAKRAKSAQRFESAEVKSAEFESFSGQPGPGEWAVVSADVVVKALGSPAERWQGPILVHKPAGSASWYINSLASLRRIGSAPSSPPPAAAGVDPTTVIHSYYDALGRNDARRVAALRKSHPGNLEDVVRGVQYAKVNSAYVQGISGGFAYVMVDVALKSYQGPKERWQGVLELEPAPSGWVISSFKGLRKTE